MNLNTFSNTPFSLCISFHLLIAHYEDVAANQTGFRAEHAKQILKEIEPFPELRTGIDDLVLLEEKLEPIKRLVADLFPEALTDNEIKAITAPFQDFLFNPTNRFKKILNNAGPKFDIGIRDFNDHQLYIFSCCLILKDHYDQNFDFSKPFFYDIPTAAGVIKHYRILYNADFMELVPTEHAVKLTPEDIDLLRDNFDDLELWKKYFPVNSWMLKGFAIVTLFDATVENAVSSLKGTLLGAPYNDDVYESVLSVFRSIYRMPNLKIGFTTFNPDEDKFGLATFNSRLKSYLLSGEQEDTCANMMCVAEFANLVDQKKYFAVSDVKKYLEKEPDNVLAQRFDNEGVQSFILGPVVKNNNLLGIIELVSENPYELNSINANQLAIVMPFLTDTIDRQYTYMINQIRAVIQKEYTTIHPSVYWKFQREAVKYIDMHGQGKEYTLKEITFRDVYPLYGQIDIKGSSDTRNMSVQLDLEDQLNTLIPLLDQIQPSFKESLPAERIDKLRNMANELHLPLRADTEQMIQTYLETHIDPLLKKVVEQQHADAPDVKAYLLETGQTGEFHEHRKMYETTVAMINEKMSIMLDKWQNKVQTAFPHYYDRFKTDGVEHNLYIGQSIIPTRTFNMADLYNLRLWQIQVLCQMEYEHHRIKDTLPYPLDVTTLILAFSQPLSIRFRMDEKRFDVDGTYNARFEMVKKRIDKAFVKNTRERVTAVGKLTIIYTTKEEETEYKKYIHFLQSKKMLHHEIDVLEVEDLQGVSGLKALRVKICYDILPDRRCYTYEEMIADTKKNMYLIS
ncbi:GAF domain-containing protein [Mucilaginibacter glaciei]|uniref:GAF domain-containing protein n=1 Tax=Mucilaginibacter glaciei TaxID=2772109 RepID=A0A926NNC9_9SPHI|nr:GAF domain-containing protein [Mucilaginibacter glaciei]MBD1391702.1 GAF domain-containing protein [Mucilaginibacter glaciei]